MTTATCAGPARLVVTRAVRVADWPAGRCEIPYGSLDQGVARYRRHRLDGALFGDRLMHSPSQFVLNLPKLPAHAVPPGFPVCRNTAWFHWPLALFSFPSHGIKTAYLTWNWTGRTNLLPRPCATTSGTTSPIATILRHSVKRASRCSGRRVPLIWIVQMRRSFNKALGFSGEIGPATIRRARGDDPHPERRERLE